MANVDRKTGRARKQSGRDVERREYLAIAGKGAASGIYRIDPSDPAASIAAAIATASAESRATGRSQRLLIDVHPDRAPEILPLHDDAQGDTEPAPDRDLADALDQARERGRASVARILNGPDMLGSEALAERLAVSRMTVNTWRRRGQVIGLEGPKRGFRFPIWQFDERGIPYPEIPRLFALLGDSPWIVFRFMTEPHPELDGMTGREALAAGRSREVIGTAESLARGTFA